VWEVKRRRVAKVPQTTLLCCRIGRKGFEHGKSIAHAEEEASTRQQPCVVKLSRIRTSKAKRCNVSIGCFDGPPTELPSKDTAFLNAGPNRLSGQTGLFENHLLDLGTAESGDQDLFTIHRVEDVVSRLISSSLTSRCSAFLILCSDHLLSTGLSGGSVICQDPGYPRSIQREPALTFSSLQNSSVRMNRCLLPQLPVRLRAVRMDKPSLGYSEGFSNRAILRCQWSQQPTETTSRKYSA
jgi:hypothetical protein